MKLKTLVRSSPLLCGSRLGFGARCSPSRVRYATQSPDNASCIWSLLYRGDHGCRWQQAHLEATRWKISFGRHRASNAGRPNGRLASQPSGHGVRAARIRRHLPRDEHLARRSRVCSTGQRTCHRLNFIGCRKAPRMAMAAIARSFVCVSHGHHRPFDAREYANLRRVTLDHYPHYIANLPIPVANATAITPSTAGDSWARHRTDAVFVL